MQYDLGTTGLALLVLMSLGFGVIAQALALRETRWVWLAGAIGYFVAALIASEAIFAWATVEDLQPMIDGLLFDEALLGGLVVGVPAAVATWYVARQRHLHGPTTT